MKVQPKRDPWWQPTPDEVEAAIKFALDAARNGIRPVDPGNAKIPPGGIHP